MKIRCIVVEDEPIAQERIRHFINRYELLELQASFDNASDALVYLKSHTVDLIFLDVEMEELTGIEMLESSHINAQVILTTAYEKYALKGYELSVVDYLLKPFSYERFIKAVDKVELAPTRPIFDDFVFIKTSYRLEKIMIDDILHIEGMGEYRRIYTKTKQILTLLTFSELEEKTSPQRVCRVHKSHMVSLKNIESVEKGMIKIGDKRIPISDTYKDYFFNLINTSNR